MFFFGGVRALGRVEECDGTYVVTHFVHVNWLPLVPLRSELRVASGERREIALQPLSVVAAYLRSWPLLGMVWLGGASLFWRGQLEAHVCIALAIASALLALVGFALGRLSRSEIEKRRALAEYVGAAVDLDWVKPELFALRQSLQDAWDEAAMRVGARGYRSALTLDRAADVDDEDALKIAFALARVEATLAPRSERPRFTRIADRVWDKVTAARAYTPARALAGSSAPRDGGVP